MIGAVRRHAPAWPVAAAGSLAWGAAMSASAAAALLGMGWQMPERIAAVAAVYAAGGALAFPLAWLIAGIAGGAGTPASRRFAAAMLALAFTTAGLTMAIYALDYRRYYAEFHDPAFTATWALQLLFTTAGAVAQFAVTGVRLFFPLGFAATLVAACLFARLRA